MRKVLYLLVSAVLIGLVGLAGGAFANNVGVQNVSLTNINAGAGTADVSFQLKQDNAWGSSASPLSNGAYDVIWVFVKYSTEGGADGSWKHAKVTGTGATADSMGAFLDVANNTGSGSWEDTTLTWEFGAQGVPTFASARVKVCAIEMVYIPQGAFYYNVGGIGYSYSNNFGGGSETLVDEASDVPSGASTGWPNGYAAFYVAKYEVSQGQWVDFLNTLSDEEASWYWRPYNRDGTGGDSWCCGATTMTVSEAADTTWSTTQPTRGMNFLNWNDCRAYASWCGLRPMTEMEFEKAGRGASAYGPESGKATYPWGNETPSTTTGTIEGGTHTLYYANYNYAGGSKPIQVGWYLSQGYPPDSTGASIYGVTDLAANNYEHMLNCQSTSTPQHGNGSVITGLSPDYTGFNWPGVSPGRGLRGGGWGATRHQRVSDQYHAAWAWPARNPHVGFRPARTLD